VAHSPELLEAIAAKLRPTYPPDRGFSYVYERRIAGITAVMIPDIQVADASGRIVCAVEIGYTRPEKLTAYRRTLKLQDVRWYDKAGHLHGDVTERVVVKREVVVKRKEAAPPDESFRLLPIVDFNASCPDCRAEYEQDAEAQREAAAAEGRAPDVDPDPDAAIEHSSAAVWGEFFTNMRRCAALCYCDQCGLNFLETDPHNLPFGDWGDVTDAWNGRHRAAYAHLKPRELTFDELREYAVSQYGLTVDYSDLPTPAEQWAWRT
jgi:hypothetical protein